MVVSERNFCTQANWPWCSDGSRFQTPELNVESSPVAKFLTTISVPFPELLAKANLPLAKDIGWFEPGL